MSNNEKETENCNVQNDNIHGSVSTTQSTFQDLTSLQSNCDQNSNNSKTKNHPQHPVENNGGNVVQTMFRNPYYKLSKELISKKYSSEEKKCENNDDDEKMTTTTKKKRKRRSYYEILKDNREKGFDTTLTHYKKVKVYNNYNLNDKLQKNEQCVNSLPNQFVPLKSNDFINKNVQKPIPVFKNNVNIITDQNPTITLMDGNLLWEYANNMHNISISNDISLNNNSNRQVNNYFIINPQLILNNNKND